MQSQALQAPDMMADDVFPVLRIEILIPQLPVGHFVAQNKVCRLQNPVRDHDRSPLLALATGTPSKFGPEICRFGMARCMSTFDEERPELLVAFAGQATLAPARAIVVPMADVRAGAERLGRVIR